jgi:glutamate/tyrosine decarboxylase-like PLP-dependent enzyme
MGGFLLPYFKRLGEPVADFDFSLPGVCSVSVDLHKYAYSPKGASLVFHRSPKLRSFQIFSFTKWLGYTLVNSTVQSTKSGGPLAAAWAVLNYVGDEGYLEFARKKLEAVKKIKQAISQIPELYLMVEPEMTLISFSSKEVNIFHIIDEMNLKGWYIQPSLSFDGIPANIHLTVTLSNVLHTEPFIHDLKESVEKAKHLPSGVLLERLKPVIDKQGAALLDNPGSLFELAGIKEGQMPKRMAALNEVLDAMPPEWREKILLHVTNGFFHPES